MIIFVKTDDGKRHETDVPHEFSCYLDVMSATEKGINPADMLVELANAGSKAVRGKNVIFDKNPILRSVAEGEQKATENQPA